MATEKPGPVSLLAAFALLLFVPPEREHAAVADGTPSAGAGIAPRPKRSWKEILIDTWNGFNDDRVLAVSAGATFYGLLALFPAIASFVSIYGLVADAGKINDQLNALGGLMPSGALDIIREQVSRITAKGNAALSGAFAIGLVTSLWSAGAGIKAMFDALNVAYGLKEERNFFKLSAVAMAFTAGAIVMVVIGGVVLVAIPPLLERFGGSGAASWIIWLARWPLLFVAISFAIALLYRYGPSPQDQHWRWLTPGSIFSALAWVLVSTAFSYYAANFGSYNATYGSLGAAIGLMTWMWLSITVILLGAELNAQIDRSTEVKKDVRRVEN